MGIDGSCKIHLKAQDESYAKKFYDDFKAAVGATGVKCENALNVSIDGRYVHVENSNDRSFFVERWVMSLMLGKKKDKTEYGISDFVDWDSNFKMVSERYKAAIEIWAEYDSYVSASQHSVYYKGNTLVEEQNPWHFFVDSKSSAQAIEEAEMYDRVMPSFKHYGEMTLQKGVSNGK